MTDAPEYVAWYANRTALVLCQSESDLDMLEKRAKPLNAIFVSRTLMQLPEAAHADWWNWISIPRGVFRGMEVASSPSGTVLRIRKQPQRGPEPSDIQTAQTADAQIEAAQRCLGEKRFREAEKSLSQMVGDDCFLPNTLGGPTGQLFGNMASGWGNAVGGWWSGWSNPPFGDGGNFGGGNCP